MTSEGRLAGKTALVTGGSRGIGAEIVRRRASDGADVAFTYNTGKAEADEVAAVRPRPRPRGAGHPRRLRRRDRSRRGCRRRRSASSAGWTSW